MSYNESPEEFDDYPSHDLGMDKGTCELCYHAQDLPPGIRFGIEDLYCNHNGCAVDSNHSCQDWLPK